MLVVYRVELAPMNQINRIGEFEDRAAGRFEDALEAGDKVVDVIYVRDNIVGNNDIGELTLARQLLGAAQPEKIVKRWYTQRICLRHRSVGWVDTETTNSPLDKIAQQIAVVACDFDYKTICPETEFAN